MIDEIDESVNCSNWAAFGSVSLASDMVRQLNNDTASDWIVIRHGSHYHVLTVNEDE